MRTMTTLPAELRQAAEKYKGRLPVPVVEIANDLGLLVHTTPDLGPTESGVIRKEDSRYVIYLNKNQAYVRQRFTIAHEIGHYVLHRDYLTEDNDLVDLGEQPLPANGQLRRSEGQSLTAEEREMEIQANEVAAELLMPEDLFTDIWNRTFTIEEVAEKFAVSPSAATVRGKVLFNAFRI